MVVKTRAKPVLGVIVRYPGWIRLLEVLPNPDEIVQREGLEIFDRMMMDPHIFACMKQRKAMLLNYSWQIEPADNSEKAVKAAEFVQNVIEKELSFYQDIKELLSALEHGYAVSEVVWKLDAGMWIPEQIIGHDFRHFGFAPDGTLIWLDSEKGTVFLNYPYKFIIHRHEATAENPYGRSVLTRCYWPWKFKIIGFEFWITVLEKFGVPSLAALFEGELTDEKIKEIADYITQELLKVNSGGAGAFAGVKEIKTIDAQGKAEDFKLLIELCNAEMSKAILGETLTVEVGERGAYAHGKVHLEVLSALVKEDAEALANTINRTLVKWIVELNFGKDVPLPRFKFDFKSIADWEKIKDALDRGVPISRKALYTVYKLPEPEDDKDSFIAPVVAAKAGFPFSEEPFSEEERSFSEKDDFFVRRLPRKMYRIT